MITKDKITEIFCIIDEFNKNLNAELTKNCNYLPMMVKENAIAAARVDARKAR